MRKAHWMTRTALGLSTGLLLGFSASAVPFSITTAAGDGADTWASTQNPTTVNGSQNGARVSTDGAGGNRGTAFLRFDLANALQNTITGGTLSFSFNRGGDQASAGPFQLFGMVDGTDADARPGDGGWREDTLTQRNAPMLSGTDFTTFFLSDPLNQGGNPQAYGVLLGSFTFNDTAFQNGQAVTLGATNSVAFGSMSVSGDGVNSLGVNLNNFLQSDTNGLVTFGIRQVNTNNRAMTIFTKERPTTVPGSPVPTLSFDADLRPADEPAPAVPEPASAAMVALAGLALTARRRIA